MSEPNQPNSDDPAAQHLADEAQQFYLSLQQSIYPTDLIESYPRIANAIYAKCKTPVELARYIDGLLQDNRGGRQGFPFKIMLELTSLKEALCGSIVNPDNTDPLWGTPVRRRDPDS